MQVGDLISVDLEKVYLGIVIELDPGWVYVRFLDGTVGSYDLDELEWEVVNASR